MKTVTISKRILRYAALFTAALIVLTHMFHVPIHAASFNPEINYQGKLADNTGSAVDDDGYNMRFRLYTQDSGGAEIWSETLCYSNDNGDSCTGAGTDSRVDVISGLFSVLLGDVSTTSLANINFNDELWLEVAIGGTSTTPSWETLSPRKKLGTVPSAFEADQLDGLDSTQFLRSDATDTMNASSTDTLLTIDQDGSGDVLNVFSGSTEYFTVLSSGNVGVNDTSPTNQFSIGGDVGITTDEADLRFYQGSNYVGFQASSSLSGDQVWTLPVSDGSSNQILATDGSGNLSWINASAATGSATTFLDLTDTPSSYTANAIPFTTTTSDLIFDTDFTYDDDIETLKVGELRVRYTDALGIDSMFIGTGNGYSTLTTGGNGNLFIGVDVGQNVNSGAAFLNTAVGVYAGDAITEGQWNTLLGFEAGSGITSGDQNTLVGESAGESINTGQENVAIGNGALRTASSTRDTVVVGAQAGSSAVGDYNTLLGSSAGSNLGAGDSNTFVGYGAGTFQFSGDGVVIIGALAGGGGVMTSNSVVIGTSAGPTGFGVVDNVTLIGDAATASNGVSDGIAIGASAAVTGSEGIAIGNSASAGANTLVIGNATYEITDINIGVNATNTIISGGTSGITFLDEYTFPTTDATTSGYILASDASGNLYWTEDSGGVTTFLGLSDTPGSYTAGSVLFTSGSAVTEDNTNFFWDDSNNFLGIGTNSPTTTLDVSGNIGLSSTQGELRFYEGENYVGFRATDTLSSNQIWTLPDADGSSDQVLQTDGSGNLSWVTNNLTTGNMSAFRLRDTSTTDLNSSATDNLVPWNTQDFLDSGTFTHSTSTNTSRVTVLETGRYMFSGAISVEDAVGVSNFRYNGRVKFRVNGTDVEGPRFQPGYIRNNSGQEETSLVFSAIVDLTANDYIEILVDRENTTTGAASMISGHSSWSGVLLKGPKGDTGSQGPAGGGANDYTDLGDTPGTLTASAIPFTNTGASALLHSTGLTFTDTNDILVVGSSRFWDDNGDNLGIGENALGSGPSGTSNVAFGGEAGVSLGSGNNNTLIGAEAGTGVSSGSNNTFVGSTAGSTATGSSNTIIGAGSFDNGSNTSVENTIVGAGSGTGITSGSYNTIIGENSGNSISTGQLNVVIGEDTSSGNGSANIVIGVNAGGTLSTGGNNIFIGENVEPSSGSIASSIALGRDANVTASNQLVIGDATYQITDINIGVNSSNTIISGGTSGGVTFLDEYTFPTTDATTSGYVLKSNAAGALFWGEGGGGAYLDLSDTPGSFTASAIPFTNTGGTALEHSSGFTFTDANDVLTVGNTLLYDVSNSFFVGPAAGNTSVSGANNTGIGANTLEDLTSGYSNVTLGTNAGLNITEGYENILIGTSAGSTGTSTSFNRNTIIGHQAGLDLTANANVFIGYRAGYDNTIGNANTFVGVQAGQNSVSNTGVTAVGYQAGLSNSGANNTYFGAYAGQSSTGSQSTLLGYFAGDPYAGTGGVYIGHQAGAIADTGNYNVAIGYRSGYGGSGTPATGANNVLVGRETGLNLTTGDENVIIGAQAGDALTTAANSTIVGDGAGSAVTTGGNNILIGYQAGDLLTDGTDNIIIGYDIDSTSASAANELNIGDTIFGNLSTGQVSIGTSTISHTLAINGSFDVYSGAINYATTTNITSIERLDLGNVEFEQDAGSVSWIDLDVTAISSAGTIMSYSAQIDSQSLLRLYSEADGSGGIDTTRVVIGTTTNAILGSGNIPDGSLIVTDGIICVDNGAGDNCDDASRTAGQIYAESSSVTAIDLAENFPTKDPSLEAGELVMLDPENPVFVKTYDPADPEAVLVGIISTKPGVLLGGFADEQYKEERKVPVALAGRVPVRVTADAGAINVGDRLTFGGAPGLAEKASALSPTVGIALEPLAEDAEGIQEILAFVNLQNPSPEGAGGVNGMITALLDFGIEITEQVTKIANLIVGKLTVGTPDNPTGITIYDTVTRLPYCITVMNGQHMATNGACEDVDTSDLIDALVAGTSTDSGAPTSTDDGTPTTTDSGTPEPTPEPPAEETPSSTDDGVTDPAPEPAPEPDPAPEEPAPTPEPPAEETPSSTDAS